MLVVPIIRALSGAEWRPWPPSDRAGRVRGEDAVEQFVMLFSITSDGQRFLLLHIMNYLQIHRRCQEVHRRAAADARSGPLPEGGG